jgi:hypothetical protein
VTFEQAATRLVQIAVANGGTLTAAHVERDRALSAEQPLVCAAARALSAGTNVVSSEHRDGEGWFPYGELTFSEIYGRSRGETSSWKRMLNRRTDDR